MTILIGQSLVLLGLGITLFGVYAILTLDGFYPRIVVTSKVEAMGFVAVVLGAMLLSGFSITTLKILIILLFELITVSASAHAVARSAWISGYRAREIGPPEDENA